ncbi:MAG: hypothetical protein QXO40_01390 [Candidatus Aenigmatarchaeota archaeon]
MFIQNFLAIIIASLFCGISIAYIFSLNYFTSLITSFLVLFFPFIISFLYSEKIYIKPIFKLNIFGMLISIVFIIFKIPFFPILSLEEVYYYSKARKIFENKITSKEIGKVSFIFILTLFIFAIFGIITKSFLLTFLPSILILSFLFPYKNSFGSILFFYSPLYLSFFIISSIIFLIISLLFLFF